MDTAINLITNSRIIYFLLFLTLPICFAIIAKFFMKKRKLKQIGSYLFNGIKVFIATFWH